MASKYVKEKLTELQGDTDKPTMTRGDFNMPFPIIDR